jgi:hypothetical protein
MFADGIRCTAIPDFDGESHTTDRQYTPSVSQSVTADTKSAAAALRFTPIFATFPNESSHFSGVLCSSKLASCKSEFDGENHTTSRQYTPAVSQSVTAVAQSATADLRASLQFSATFLEKLLIFSRCVLQANTCRWNSLYLLVGF